MMSPLTSTIDQPRKLYRLPGIEREGIAQLSLLETALWPLQGGALPSHRFETSYEYAAGSERRTAHVTVRAPVGLQPVDELVLWGLLGATPNNPQSVPLLIATPYWILRHLGLKTGGYQYRELHDSLVRLASASYHNDAFYNPQSEEHEEVTFHFFSAYLPTVGGKGGTVDDRRCWRIEWNPGFFRFCRMTGGNLLFDLALYRQLTPASRRLFLKLKDRFWRSKRVFMNVDDLTINGLGFSAERPLFKRKFDLTACMRELLAHRVIALGRGQTDPKESFLKRGKGSYVVAFHEGEYFREVGGRNAGKGKDAVEDDPLYFPLREIGVDGPAIRRLFKSHSRGLIERWVTITDSAMHENPRGFDGFRVSPAAFLIDAIQQNRTTPDWHFAHEKRKRQQQWEQEQREAATDEKELRRIYQDERSAALKAYLASPEGKQKYDEAFPALVELHRYTNPERYREAAREATLARIERMDFHFPEYAVWAITNDRRQETNRQAQ